MVSLLCQQRPGIFLRPSHTHPVASCHKKAAILLGFTSFTQTKGSRKNLGKKAESADTYLHFSLGTMRTWIP